MQNGNSIEMLNGDIPEKKDGRPVKTNIEKLLQAPTEGLIEMNTILLRDALNQHPELSTLSVEVIPHDQEPHTAGFFWRDWVSDDEVLPAIGIVAFNKQHMTNLMEKRKGSLMIAADMLGVDFKDLQPEVAHTFIVAHELAHCLDYIHNFQSRYETPNSPEAAIDWEEQYGLILSTLPIPHYAPGDTLTLVSKYQTLGDFLGDFPDTREFVSSQDIQNLDELVRAQEIAYRNSTFEKYADDFATMFVKRIIKDGS